MCVTCQVFDGFQIRSECFDATAGVTLNKIAGNIKALLIIIKVDSQVEQLAGFMSASKVGTLSVHSSICTSTSPRSSAVWMIGVEPLIILGVML